MSSNGQQCPRSETGQHAVREDTCYGTRNHSDHGGLILPHRIRRCDCGWNECFGWESAKPITRIEWFGTELPLW